MNFTDIKNFNLRRLYPYMWLVSLAAQLFLLYDIFGILKAAALFVVVTVLQVRYKFKEKSVKNFSVAGVLTALFLAVMVVVTWQVYPYWDFADRIDNTTVRILFMALEILSVGMFVHPFINIAVSRFFDDKSFTLKKLGAALIVVIPVYFIIFCYLPCEIYVNNISGFNFPFQSFILRELYYFTVFSLITAFIISLLVEPVYKILESVIMGTDICCYIQYMFLNSNLNLLNGESMNWEDYTGFAVVTLFVWLAVISGLIIFNIKKQEIYNKISLKIPAVLFAVQALSAGMMIIMAGGKLYSTDLEYMSGEEQYTVSGAGNVIMFVLDATDNDYFKEILEKDPEAFEGYEDFTLYSNTCSVFDSTPTSITQMITGMDFSVELNGEEWYRTAWNSEKAVEFFDRFHNDNYIINGYNSTYDEQILGKGKIDNYKKIDSSEYKSQVQIDSKGLAGEFTTLSMYRILPFILKRFTDYERINFDSHVEIEDDADYKNDDFAENMHLKKSELDKNYLIIQHLDGTHPPCTDYIEESKQLLAMIRDYMNQLREFGVYDDASIIITADHGRHDDSCYKEAGTPVLMIKRSNVSKTELTVSPAPVYHEDMQATLLECAGLYDCETDINPFGRSVFDIKEDEVRERTWYDRRKDSDFKSVKILNSSGLIRMNHNSYYGFTYTGDTSVLEEMVRDNRPTAKYQMTDYKG